jgi:hypothetical protein
LGRPIGEAGNLALDLGEVRPARLIVPMAVPVANSGRLASALASQSVVACRLHTLAGPSMR